MKSVIVDAHCICHKEKHAKKDLAFEGVGTGVIFGFMQEILKLARTFETNRLLFAWDSPHSQRKTVYPSYKNNRKEVTDPEQIELDRITRPQFEVIRTRVLKDLGFTNSWQADGLEADDLIASIVKNNEGIFYIASADEDLYQLLTPGIAMYKPHKKTTYHYDDFIREFEIDPSQWNMVKALAGCSSDAVPGIVGVGEKTAIRFLLGKLKPGSKAFNSIVAAKSENGFLTRNLKLVTLPFPTTPAIFVNRLDKPSLDGYIETCQRYGLNTLMESDAIRKWRQHVIRE
jgi:DNA polymerase-1